MIFLPFFWVILRTEYAFVTAAFISVNSGAICKTCPPVEFILKAKQHIGSVSTSCCEPVSCAANGLYQEVSTFAQLSAVASWLAF